MAGPARRSRISVFALALAVLLLTPFAGRGAATAQETDSTSNEPGGLLVYHQITDLDEESAGVGYPVLSADGTTAVFADSPATANAPETPNRIFVVDADGTGLREVDAYPPLCNCGSAVDISDDGQTVVSTDAVQIRIADGGGARELIVLAGGEITVARITGDGQTVFFLVRRDTATADGTTTLARGVWAIEVAGEDLRPVIGAEEVAELVGVPVAETGCCFHGNGSPLAVSSDGGRVVVGAYAGTGEHLVAVDGDGGSPQALIGPANWVKGVAISADGATIAYDVVLPNRHNGADEIGVVAGGGEPRPLTIGAFVGFDEPLSLSADGSRLLVSPNGLLIDTETGDLRQLGVLTPGAGGQDAVLTDELPRATMNAEATRFLYAMRTIRCADCVNLPEQLATLDLDPADLGAAPVIAEASIEPDEIPLDYQAATTASAEVEADGTLIAVGMVALRDGRYDLNVARGTVLSDDGENGDARANDGVFTNAGIVHGPVEAREDDTGPRLILIQAEVETGDGLRHATAVDAGTLTVVEGR